MKESAASIGAGDGGGPTPDGRFKEQAAAEARIGAPPEAPIRRPQPPSLRGQILGSAGFLLAFPDVT